MNNGGGLSGDSKSLQNSQGGSTPPLASTYVSFNDLGFSDYKAAYIALRRAITALKRGKPTDYDLEMLGCSIDKFRQVNQYLIANEFEIKERAAFVKKLEFLNVDLFDGWSLKFELDNARFNGDTETERILGNILFNGYNSIY